MPTTFSKFDYNDDSAESEVYDASAESEVYDVIPVKQSQAVVLHPLKTEDDNETEPLLLTDFLGPCIGIAMFNKTTRATALAHIDDYCTASSIIGLVQNMRSSDKETLELHFTGGNNHYFGPEGGKLYFLPILQKIFVMPNIKIASKSLFRKEKTLTEFDFLAIDTHGQVFHSNKLLGAEYQLKPTLKFKMEDIAVISKTVCSTAWGVRKIVAEFFLNNQVFVGQQKSGSEKVKATFTEGHIIKIINSYIQGEIYYQPYDNQTDYSDIDIGKITYIGNNID